MKYNLKKKVWCITLLLASLSTYAQKKITEGIVTYTVSYDLPEDKKQFEAMMPKEIQCYFRGDSSATIIDQGEAKIKSILNHKADFRSLLIDVPSFNQKIAVQFTPDDLKKLKETEPDFKGTAADEKQKIAGYDCFKVDVKEAKSGTSYEMWVTKDLEITPNVMTHFVNNLGGVPVKFVTFNNGVKINAELRDIKEEKIPAGFFTASKDYKPMSLSELTALTGGQ